MKVEDEYATTSAWDMLKIRLRGSKTTIRTIVKNPISATGLVIIVVLVILSIISPFIAPYDPIDVVLESRLLPPSSEHWLGTDNFGRDILSRILIGSRLSLISGFVVIFTAVIIGIVAGSLAGYYGKWVDEIIMRITDIFMAFPSFLLAMIVVSVLGKGVGNVLIAMVIVWWPIYTRLIRGQVLVLRETPMIESERALGASSGRILLRHVLPNSFTPVLVQASMDVGFAILVVAGLSFLGLGAQPPIPEWGSMIAEGRTYIEIAWWFPVFPGITISAAVLGFNLFGDGLRDAFDPKLRGR